MLIGLLKAEVESKSRIPFPDFFGYHCIKTYWSLIFPTSYLWNIVSRSWTDSAIFYHNVRIVFSRFFSSLLLFIHDIFRIALCASGSLRTYLFKLRYLYLITIKSVGGGRYEPRETSSPYCWMCRINSLSESEPHLLTSVLKKSLFFTLNSLWCNISSRQRRCKYGTIS